MVWRAFGGEILFYFKLFIIILKIKFCYLLVMMMYFFAVACSLCLCTVVASTRTQFPFETLPAKCDVCHLLAKGSSELNIEKGENSIAHRMITSCIYFPTVAIVHVSSYWCDLNSYRFFFFFFSTLSRLSFR